MILYFFLYKEKWVKRGESKAGIVLVLVLVPCADARSPQRAESANECGCGSPTRPYQLLRMSGVCITGLFLIFPFLIKFHRSPRAGNFTCNYYMYRLS